MIALLTGLVAHRDATTVVVDVAGVGYLVHVADPSDVPAVGRQVTMHTSLQVREDSMTLYGFADPAARAMFVLLLTSSGIGPKLAQAALATHRPAALRTALATADLAALSEVPGIGRKVAQRLVLELRDKVGGVGGDLDLADGPISAATGPRADAVAALASLGYVADEIRGALAGVEESDTEAMVRVALRRLGQGVRG